MSEVVINSNPETTHNHPGGCRTGKSLEIAFVGSLDLGVKSGQAQGSAGELDKGNQPAKSSQAIQCPQVHHKSGSQANSFNEWQELLQSFRLSM